MQDSILQYNDHANNRKLPDTLRLASVQSSRQCALSLTLANQHKTSGFDKVRNSLLTKAPLAAARHLNPLLAKVQFTAAEPFEFKGSIAHPLLKPDKIVSISASYRSISLENDTAKHHHKFLRSTLLAAVDGFFSMTQQSCLKGRVQISWHFLLALVLPRPSFMNTLLFMLL